MNLNLLRQRRTELRTASAAAKKERAAIGEAAVRENRKMTDAERKAFVDFGPTIEALDTQLVEVVELITAAEAAVEAERELVITRPDPDAVAAAAAERIAGIQPATRIEVADMTKKQGYFGAQLLAVRRAAFALKESRGISAGDQDLLKPMRAAATGLNTDTESEGGFLVTQDRATTVLQRAYTTGQVLSRVNRMPIGPGSNGITIPAIDETDRANSSRYGGIVSSWVGQGNTVTPGKPKFRIIDLKLRKLMALVYSTDELLVDAVAFEAWVNRYLPMELMFRAEDAVFNGVGASQPLGIMNSGAVITVTRSSAGRILGEDLRAMVNRLWAPLWARAAFFVDQSTLGEFSQLGIAVGTGGYADPSYKPAGSTPGQVYATYMNIPIIPVEYCAALGTSGDIILVNLDEYIVIDKGGVDSAVSMHVAFLTDESVFRFIYRIDGQLTWSAPLTPKSGGATLSTAVILS